MPFWTSDDVFKLRKMPKSITIVGGGYIACELGHFFHGIGVDTLLVVRRDQLLDLKDNETRTVFMKGFATRVLVTFNSTISSATHDDSRFHIRIVHAEGTRSERDSEALLFCIGRVPNSGNIGIENTELKPNAHGFVETDDRLRTPVEGVYAIGDIAGHYMFTHAANFESEYLVKQIVENRDEPIDYGPMPHAVFTSPEIAGVGVTEEDLKKSGISYVAASVPFMNTTKGRAVKEEYGLCKLIVHLALPVRQTSELGAIPALLFFALLEFVRFDNLFVQPVTDVLGSITTKREADMPLGSPEDRCN